MPLLLGFRGSVCDGRAAHAVYSVSVVDVMLHFDKPQLACGRLLLFSDRPTCLVVLLLNQNPHD